MIMNITISLINYNEVKTKFNAKWLSDDSVWQLALDPGSPSLSINIFLWDGKEKTTLVGMH